MDKDISNFNRRLYNAKKIDHKNLYVADVPRAGVRVYWSYETPVAFKDIENNKLYINGENYSKTTSKHKTQIEDMESVLSSSTIEYGEVDDFFRDLHEIMRRECNEPER